MNYDEGDSIIPTVLEPEIKDSVLEYIEGYFLGFATGIEVGETATDYEMNVIMLNDSIIELISDHFDSAIVLLSKDDTADFITGKNDSLYSFVYEIPSCIQLINATFLKASAYAKKGF
ncbi:MAG TPA: hypothetical protein ENJ95_19505 [Bacteroidetes bacterium]|nr:hypothetical protein [Bacteroidota bacterium]